MSDASTPATPDPGAILQIGFGFWPAKTLLSAVELGLFTVLAEGPADGGADRGAVGPRLAGDV